MSKVGFGKQITNIADEFVVRQSRLFALFLSGVSLGFGVAGTFRTYQRVSQNTFDPFGGSIVIGFIVLLFAGSIWFAAQAIRQPVLARIIKDGWINRQGHLICWHEIGKMYRLTGVLFVTSQTGNRVLRIDPAEIGWSQFGQMIEYLKAAAPAQLTGKL